MTERAERIRKNATRQLAKGEVRLAGVLLDLASEEAAIRDTGPALKRR